MLRIYYIGNQISVISFLIVANGSYKNSSRLRASFLSSYNVVYAGQNARIPAETLMAYTLC